MGLDGDETCEFFQTDDIAGHEAYSHTVLIPVFQLNIQTIKLYKRNLSTPISMEMVALVVSDEEMIFSRTCAPTFHEMVKNAKVCPGLYNLNGHVNC